MGLFRNKKRQAPPERAFASAVVVAAGNATRMGQINKILAPLGDMPAIGHCLLAFERSRVNEVVVVAREGDILTIADLCKGMGFGKVSKIVKGGADRVSSALIGLGEISPCAQLAAVHDGARPCVTPELIDRVLAAAEACGAAVPGEPASDTLKELSPEGYVARTLDRTSTVMIQTPQAFEATLIRGALTRALGEGWRITDDCAAVERMGMQVRIVPGERTNIKLTVPQDLVIAQAILAAAEEQAV